MFMSSYAQTVPQIIKALAEENTASGDGTQSEPLQEVDIYVEEDRITLIPKQPQIIDSATPDIPERNEETPIPSQQAGTALAALTISFYFVLILSSLFFQLYSIFNVPTATIYLIPKSQQITLTGTLQPGRVLNPITISQSQRTKTTGHGHQDSQRATGTITFYNGSFSSQMIAAGAVITGADGVQVATDTTISVPPNNPPRDGQASVTAYALNAGSKGNIAAGDIHVALSNVLEAVNLTDFTGGLDTRDFRVVTKADIDTPTASLKTEVLQSMQSALQGKIGSGEGLRLLPCTTIITSDRKAGEEADQVKVTVSETCEAIIYSQSALQDKVTALLSTKAARRLGAGYSLLEGSIQIQVTSASRTTTHRPLVSFTSTGTFAYTLYSQEHIKSLVAGKTKQQALLVLQHLPGIESASIVWDGEDKLPKGHKNIHLVIIYQ
jgi:hypothetical protein